MDARASRGWAPICLALMLIGSSRAWPQEALPAPEDSPVLAWFDFEGEAVETGPYTLIAYEDARGSVRLTTRYRLSGFRSVEIRDVAGDGELAELQGFFREMSQGKLYFHFAVLIALSEEPLNIALAGKSHFRLKKHGIGFWLKARDGTLFHVTGGAEVPLFPIRALTWYVADVVYDIDRGVYDLSIRAEGDEEPLVVLVDQPNAVGLPGSRLHKFSFIGDPPGRDTSNAVFYVEDILISSDRPVPAQGEFVAPGRRMLFVDLDEHYRSLLYERPRCLPALGPADFGFGDPDIQELASLGALDLYDRLADRRAPRTALHGLPPYLTPRLEAMRLWGRGCAARLRYEEGLVELEDPQTVFTKLSDVHFKLGDLDGERRYREKVYGSLRR